MDKTTFWKNFRLGEELSISGAFIYNGLRRFYEAKNLDHTDEIFEIFYYLSIGFERLMKIAIVLLEHDEAKDQKKFESSLMTHSHQELIGRIKKRVALNLGSAHNDFLALLTKFYKSFRYDRFTLESHDQLHQERNMLFSFLGKHLNVEFKNCDSHFGHWNDERYKEFMRRTVLKLSNDLYTIVQNRSSELNLSTCELRSGSKAETVFLGSADIPAENVLWKELLVFFMNTKSTSGYLNFLRNIEPLEFDPGLVDDYLECFQSDSAKANVSDQLESLYEDIENKSERLDMMKYIGAPYIHFVEDDDVLDDEIEDFNQEGLNGEK
jgi:hypothetical protein